MLQLLILNCWKHITHASKKTLLLILCWSFPSLACLLSSSWNKLPLYFWLLSFPSSMFHPSSILPFVLHLSLYILSVLCASRFSASFQAGFKQLCETSKCPSLCRLFGKADNDIPNPADHQLIALFHHPSSIILCPQPSPLLHLWQCCLDHWVPIFAQQGLRFSIINTHLHLCIPQMPLFLPP